MSKLLSDRVKKVKGSDLSLDRYDFIRLSEVEPDFGNPTANNSFAGSEADGTRKWIEPSAGLTVSGNTVTVDVTTASIDSANLAYATSNTLFGVIDELDSAISQAVQGSLSSVVSDTTLTGDGSTSSPLSVVNYSHDHYANNITNFTESVQDVVGGFVAAGPNIELNYDDANNVFTISATNVTGYTGSRGYTGSQGNIGYTGSQGPIGYTGSQGVQGYTGSQGIQGIQGVRGYTGSQGVQGDIGYTGSQGSQGPIGYTGSQGDIGYTGSQGDQGDIGYTGSQGVQGIQGYTGSQGIQGPIGYTGSQGIQGVTGYTGSQGIQGPIGYTGSQGVIGYTGSQGVIGYTGSQGIQGPIGYTGSQGPVAGTDGQVIYNNGGIAGGANVWFDDTNQRLGINTSSPSYDLDVNGDTNIAGTLNINGSAIEINDLADGFTNVTSIGVGTNVLTGTGNLQNTGLGYNALSSITTGTLNIGIGYLALEDDTSGKQNVAIGSGSLRNNTTGRDNVAVGQDTMGAGTTLTTGIYNTALGSFSMNNLTTGERNIAVGFQSHYFLNSGLNNIAIGAAASAYLTSGVDNTVIGRSAGFSSTTGSYNTIMGYRSGYSNVSGNYNTAIGYETLYDQTSGSYNTVMGGHKGSMFGLDLTTANNRIVLSDGQGRPVYHANHGTDIQTSSTNQTVIYTFDSGEHNSAKVVISANDGTDTFVAEMIIAINTAENIINATQYGQISTSTFLVNYDVDLSAGNARILATAPSATTTTYKVQIQLM